MLLLLFSVGISNKATMHQCILFISCVNVLTAQNVFLNFDMFSDFTVDMVCYLFYRDAFLADVVCLIQSRQCASGNVPYIMNCFGPSMSAKYANIEWSLPAQPISFAERKEFRSVLAGTPQLTLPLPATKQFMCFCS